MCNERISNGADILSMEDIVERMEYLAEMEDRGQMEEEELGTLKDLINACRGNGGDYQHEGDWFPGILIRDSYFKEYAQELAEEIGLIKEEQQWPYTCIDWDDAADELKGDYTEFDFDGVSYFGR